jgi:hypothetical protein
MLYHNFYCILSCYFLLTKPGLSYLYSCSYTGMGYLVIEVSSFKGTQQNSCLSLHLRMETDPVSKTLCSLVYRIMDDNQAPKPSNSEF